ncbi:MAG: phosphoribosyl-AMP cyclohydrolase [Alphaproteobacteria bacterium]|nr:phosphoribosyl-AMP cyclohydrolase [Alphaproteobacteria bacterium]
MIEAIAFNAEGLIPAAAQQHDTGEMLMLAWMNRDAVEETLRTGYACYWSRSRRQLWRKGETSGHRQRLVEFRSDCDGDTVLLLVDQTGAACHTGQHNCFFRAWRQGRLETIGTADIDPKTIYRT